MVDVKVCVCVPGAVFIVFRRDVYVGLVRLVVCVCVCVRARVLLCARRDTRSIAV